MLETPIIPIYSGWRNKYIRDFIAGNPADQEIPDESTILRDWRKLEQEINEKAARAYEEECKAALEDCKKAWAAEPKATHAWHFHHSKLIEKLMIDEGWDAAKVVAVRIGEIMQSKARTQQLVRLRNFRPVKPGTVTQESTSDELEKAHKEQVPNHEDWISSGGDFRYGNLKGTY